MRTLSIGPTITRSPRTDSESEAIFDAHVPGVRAGNEQSAAASRRSIHRPFIQRRLALTPPVGDRTDRERRAFPTPATELENSAICCTRGARTRFCALAVRQPPDVGLCGRPTLCFPFYTYDPDGSNRRENITDRALDQFRSHYNDPVISKWSIFDYVYALLHHPAYRAKLAKNPKPDLPRIPFAPEFRTFQRAGQSLVRLHLDYEKLEPHPLTVEETPGHPLSYLVEDKMRLSRDKTRLVINPSLTLSGIPPETFEYRLGNRSALDWVIDQYQFHTDPHSGITSDPNRKDDLQYILRLIGQVIRVSIETVNIMNGLPPEFTVPSV